jgi:hypothetical protein
MSFLPHCSLSQCGVFNDFLHQGWRSIKIQLNCFTIIEQKIGAAVLWRSTQKSAARGYYNKI